MGKTAFGIGMEKEHFRAIFAKTSNALAYYDAINDIFLQENAYNDFCLKNQRRSMEDVLKKLAAKGVQVPIQKKTFFPLRR